MTSPDQRKCEERWVEVPCKSLPLRHRRRRHLERSMVRFNKLLLVIIYYYHTNTLSLSLFSL